MGREPCGMEHEQHTQATRPTQVKNPLPTLVAVDKTSRAGQLALLACRDFCKLNLSNQVPCPMNRSLLLAGWLLMAIAKYCDLKWTATVWSPLLLLGCCSAARRGETGQWEDHHCKGSTSAWGFLAPGTADTKSCYWAPEE
jgi:hypothetical protein